MLKKIIFLLPLIFFSLISCNNSSKVYINGNISEIEILNILYESVDINERNDCFITLIYDSNAPYSHFLWVSSNTDLNNDDFIEVDCVGLINYDSNNIITNNGAISESDLENGSILILYTINNEVLATSPAKLVVESIYYLGYKTEAILDYSHSI